MGIFKGIYTIFHDENSDFRNQSMSLLKNKTFPRCPKKMSLNMKKLFQRASAVSIIEWQLNVYTSEWSFHDRQQQVAV